MTLQRAATVLLGLAVVGQSVLIVMLEGSDTEHLRRSMADHDTLLASGNACVDSLNTCIGSLNSCGETLKSRRPQNFSLFTLHGNCCVLRDTDHEPVCLPDGGAP